jgi:drug/metabolite transporter (DMT)-like permease
MANEPLFFSALMGTVSLAGFLVYLAISPPSQGLKWNRAAIVPFLGTGIFETISILCIITALSVGRVVVIAPIAASYPVWSLIEARIFLRDLEPVHWRTVLGILSVVAGNAAIHFAR